MSQWSNNQNIKSFVEELRVKCKERNIPVISPETEAYIKKLLLKHKPKICLEIWSAVAYSTIVMANIIKERSWVVYSYEVSYAVYTQGVNNIKQSWLTNIILYPFDINKVNLQKLLNKKIDFAFIDWQKDQYANYLMKIQNMLVSDGVIVLDDVIRYHNRLTWLYWYLQKKQTFYEIVDTEPWDGIMIIK